MVFEVSTGKVHTFTGFKRKRAAKFSEHAVLDGKPRLQHNGTALDEVSYAIRFDVRHGITPKKSLENLEKTLNAGEAKSLIIGTKVLGDFALLSVDEDWQQVDNKGNLLVANVTLNLKEFV